MNTVFKNEVNSYLSPHHVIFETQCVKSLRIRRFSSPHIPTFGLNTERYSVSLRILSEYGKTRTRKTPNTDTFHAVASFDK